MWRCGVLKAGKDSKESRYPWGAGLNEWVEQRCLRLKSRHFSFRKVSNNSPEDCCSALYCDRHRNGTGICACWLTSWLWFISLFLSILQQEQTWHFSFVFKYLHNISCSPNKWDCHPFKNEKPSFTIFFLFLSSLSPLSFHANTVWFRITAILIHLCITTEQNNYIHVCTMKMNSHCLYLYGTNIQNTYIRYKKKRYLYISCVWQVC